MKPIENLVKNIAIRARFAIGLTCLKRAFRRADLQGDDSVRVILNRYAQFTSSEKLDVWEAEIEHYSPGGSFYLAPISKRYKSANDIVGSLQELNKSFAEYNTPANRSTWYEGVQVPIYDLQVYENLLLFYENLSRELITMINYCEEIATQNLYSSTGKYSEVSLTPTLKIIELSATELDFEQVAKRYPFSSERGWGDPFLFDSFLK